MQYKNVCYLKIEKYLYLIDTLLGIKEVSKVSEIRIKTSPKTDQLIKATSERLGVSQAELARIALMDYIVRNFDMAAIEKKIKLGF